MPSQERIPRFLNTYMDIHPKAAEQGTDTGKTFLTQVHLAVHYSFKRKACYVGLKDCKDYSANGKHEDVQNEHYRKMIDEPESEDDRRHLSSLSVITEPKAFSTRQSLVNHNSVSINRTFTPLPIKIEIQTPSDKATCRANIYPAREKHSLDTRKGFSSITITARRYIASLSNAPKEISSDPASSLCRSNDLLMKAPVSSDEHDQQCRYLDSGDYYSQSFKPSGFLQSQELFCQPGIISNVEANHVGLKESDGNKNHKLFSSVVCIKRNQNFPRTIYYVYRFFYLPLGQYHAANQRIYKSTTSFKIKGPPVKPANTCIRKPTALAIPDSSQDKPEAQTSSPSFELQYTVDEAKQEIQAHQEQRCQYEPCQGVSHYLNMKALDLLQTLNKDSLPAGEIYAQKYSLSQCFSDPGAERSNATTFNFIFGKQISNQKRNKQNSLKENIPPQGYTGHKPCRPTGNDDKENMPFPELTENNNSREFSHEIMSLQEALEYHRPDFIFNSQERVLKLELMAHQRKIQKQDLPKSTLPKFTPKSANLRRKIFTVPHPLSDNLFKPKERTISGREMQQRSKRIYNSLPEVKKKKEDEEKRLITESNRLRAQLFKKKLLNQILQRSLD
ncbi:(E2-independent) E3 ubiquitin-conjugating enzyme FATS [Pseudophryne corroboree]|uniref:(E2-independent) E3 ubiquitin-conjugating enzyme FATS n=1 Tax=Pseudophryne corroboree TaxID=495146 RepID=UPI003081292F